MIAFNSIPPSASAQLNRDAAHTRTAMHDLMINMLRAVLYEGKITPAEFERAVASFNAQFARLTETRAQMALVARWSAEVADLCDLRGMVVRS